MRQRHLAMRLIISVIAFTLSACDAVSVDRRTEMPIASARLQAAGTPVIVNGIVTVASATLDEGFALQDASGGIYVSRTAGAAVRIGDRVRIDGRIVAPNNQIAIEPADIAAMGTGSIPVPGEIRTGAVGPATEGRLIAVQGKIVGDVVDDQPWGWKVYLDDGSGPLLVFIATKTGFDTKPLRAGQQLRITGFSGRYEQHTELLPRAPGDIILQSGSGR